MEYLYKSVDKNRGIFYTIIMKRFKNKGVTVFEIEDQDNIERISGITFSNFQIYGQSNNGVGIDGIQDTDRVIIENLVINNIGIGVRLHGADAASIHNSWISETTSSIILNGASQQVNISNNHVGAQPGGTTIELENPQWFNIVGNNIYPDGSSNICLYNPYQGVISGNSISSRYNGIIEFLPNQNGELGNDNLISGNLISVVQNMTHPDGKNKNWGIIHLNANNTHISNNQILAERMPENYIGILIEGGENNRVLNNSIGVNSPSTNKISINKNAEGTVITNNITEEELSDEGINTVSNSLPSNNN